MRSYKIRLSGFTPTKPNGFTTKGSSPRSRLLLPRLNGEKLESNRVPAAEDAAARHSEASSERGPSFMLVVVVAVVS